MQVTINIPDEIGAKAQARGLSLEEYVERLIVFDAATPKARLVRLGPGPFTLEEAGRWIRDTRAASHLNGLSIKALIDEGRKY